MNSTTASAAMVSVLLGKDYPDHPAFYVDAGQLLVNGKLEIAIGNDRFVFDGDTSIALPANMSAGTDYEVVLNPDTSLTAHVFGAATEFGRTVIGGFHYAPGGNAIARAGGGAEPAINPFSIYDVAFRPACPNPRGMTLVDGRFWCDIYLLGTNHKTEGTSRWGASIADGDSLDRLNYADAVAIMAEHGKQLLGVTEFWAAAYGVAEKQSRDDDPETTEIRADDLAYTSKWGLFQATGCMWQWGHDEDPDEPRASIFGGSWIDGSRAGSRYALLDCWPEDSDRNVGARGRSDHLIHAD